MANQASNRRRQEKKRKKELQRKAKHKRQSQTRKQPHDPVVGYVAMQGKNLLCDEGRYGFVIGSRSEMKTFIENHGLEAGDYLIRAASSLHILAAMSLGGKYAFDQESYQRLLEPANVAGLRLKPVEFMDVGSEGIYLARVDPNTLARR